MQHFQAIFLADDADDTLPKDEIDNLFEKLKPIEPPPSLIQRILDAVAKLPPPTQNRPPMPGEKIEPADRLIVRNEQRPAS